MVRIPFGPEPEIPGRCREIDSSRDTRKARRDRFQPRKKKGVCKQLQLMMRSLQHSPETLPADPCRIILRPPSVKFIKKEKRKTKKTMDRRCRYSIRTPRSILDPFMPRIEREIGSVNVEDAFDSSSNRSLPIIVGRPFKKGEKKIPDENSSPPIPPFPPSPRYLLANCIEPPLDPSGDASSRRCRRGPRTCPV